MLAVRLLLLIEYFVLFGRPGMNSCAISEKETTKALNDLYTVPAPQIGISSDGRHAPSSFTTSSALHLNQRLGDNIVTVSGKKKNGCKDGTNIANFSDIAQISNSERKNQQASAKSRSLTDVNGYPLDTNSLSKADLEHGNKLTGYKKEKLKAGHKNLGRYSDGGALTSFPRSLSSMHLLIFNVFLVVFP